MTLGRAAFVVLGCAKNQVEAESMSSRLARMGWQLTSDIPNASVLVVHTCGFLEAARNEAMETVASLRRASPKAFLVMTGCFAQYLGGKKPKGVDALLGTGEFNLLPEVMTRGRSRPKPVEASELKNSRMAAGGYHDAELPRPLLRDQLSTYLRVSEGCNHRCTFCVIPQLRGNLKSRSADDILAEANGLLDRGVRELVLISQDTTDYGRDLSSGLRLPGLLRRLLALRDLRWLRTLYAYPSEVNEELISLLAGEERLCRYVDMPLQHISDRILKSMRRDWGEKETLSLLDRLKDRVPDLALRTTFIVGYPGETEDDFRRLLALVETGVFEHMGVFPYSREERSPSFHLDSVVPAERTIERQERLVEAQSRVAARRAASRVGKTMEVLVEKDPNGSWIARARHQAPEVDGGVRLLHTPGQSGFYQARIVGHEGIDLTAELLSPRRRVAASDRASDECREGTAPRRSIISPPHRVHASNR